jgi:hypothetical protein
MTDRSDILSVNLAALKRNDPAMAARIDATPSAEVAWQPSKAGPLTATLRGADRALTLASRYDPLGEASRFAQDADVQKHACVVVMGVGLGYHVTEVMRRLKDGDVLVIFEPDTALLRAVLERVDHTAWLGRPHTIFCDTHTDRATLIARFERYAGLVTQGTQLLIHPPSRQRQPDAFAAFSQMIADTLAYCRTNVATTLVNSTRTIENSTANLAHYAAGATTQELLGAASGATAVCVGAGPSLVKNVDLLADPAVRRNVVVIAAQTTLKPLLDRGIRPDFVTALDWSAISQRFYEGLPPLDDVTLVAEPKAHPSIIDSFPGPVRLARSQFNDELLGPLARPITPIPQGATVAHLSFYLAQHLGCDPIVMIGQDLGFSDGLYYAPGTAIHDVWSSELSPFNTVEMMEWQRIVRHKGLLQRLQDVNGSPIFSDEQMLTYLKQFERDFAAATARGLTVIDATEGGVPKQGVLQLPLSDALRQYALRPVPAIPQPPRGLDEDRFTRTRELLACRIHEIVQLREATLQTVPILQQMREHQRDRHRMTRLFERMDKLQHRVEKQLGEAFRLVSALNAIGAFKRVRSDRRIEHQTTDPYERQVQQIERDLENLHWLVQACDETLVIFRDAQARIERQAGAIVTNAAAADTERFATADR